MRASLPMYDLPGLEAATDAWWAGLAAAFRAEGLHQVPERLTREGGHAALWTAPDLLFSQTCGYPLTHALAGRVTLVATPIYDCPGCDGGRYRSEILVRADDAAGQLADLKGRRAAVNAADSQSGCHALRHAAMDLADEGHFFGSVVLTGSHRASKIGRAHVCTPRGSSVVRPQGWAGRGTLVATPSYDCPGCDGGRYRSEIRVRADDAAGQLADLKGRRAAVNAADSQSGCHALRHAAMDLADEGHFFGSVVLTGSHRASMQAVAAGEADVCAIDCVTWCLLQRSEPALTTRLRVLASSQAAPALPYIAHRDIPGDDLQRLRAGLARPCGSSEERRVGKECVSTGRSRGSAYH